MCFDSEELTCQRSSHDYGDTVKLMHERSWHAQSHVNCDVEYEWPECAFVYAR
jgi:hypothetical protein